MAMISICVFVAAVSVRVIQKKGDEKNTELKMESSRRFKYVRSFRARSFVEAQRSMGLLYFLELEDYEKKVFRRLKMPGKIRCRKIWLY